MRYARVLSKKSTPQTQAIPGSAQVPNNAGGYAWAIDDWGRLDRFLVLGSESGTYYVGERALTRQNAEAVLRCIKIDGQRVVDRIVEISESGQAPKNSPAIFALALCASDGDAATRRSAFAAVPRVCRTGTHLFEFADAIEHLRGWGRGARRAIANWYAEKDVRELVYQVVKYQQRVGWSHRDLLRLTHPKATGTLQEIYYWLVKGWPDVGDEPHPDEALRIIWAFERAKRAASADEIASLIREYRLTREMMPTQWLTSPKVYEALLDDMPLTALIRNLATMTRIGLLTEGGDATKQVVAHLDDAVRLRRARVHPIGVLAALKTYVKGRGERSDATWTPVASIVDALDRAFYATVGHVEPTGRRFLFGLDVSGSMAGTLVNGIPGLEARVAAGGMALVTAAVEPHARFVAFDTEPYPLAISPRQRLDDVVSLLARTGGGGTDCAVPIRWATEHKVAIDVFVILTDSETWAGDMHPIQALQEYRERMGLPAKLVVVAMASNHATIADPGDAGILNVVGFDIATPQLISDFAR